MDSLEARRISNSYTQLGVVRSQQSGSESVNYQGRDSTTGKRLVTDPNGGIAYAQYLSDSDPQAAVFPNFDSSDLVNKTLNAKPAGQ
jgi:uncharacterized protein (DUF58 family)